MDTADLLRRLTEASGVSGHEDEVRAIVREALEPLVDEMRQDALGNLIAVRHGSGGPEAPTIMLASHQDEIGLMVTMVDEGFVRFTTVGGWDPRVLLAQPVLVHGRRSLPGVIGSRPPHVLPPAARRKAVPVDELLIDVGLPAAEVAELVRVGDVITMRRQTTELAGGRWSGKAMDNRASVAAMCVALGHLAKRDHAWAVAAVATTQEEVGLKGAATAAWGIAPAAAVALDLTFAKQPGVGDPAFDLGDGPIVAFGPNVHPVLFERLVAAAGELEMKHKVEPVAGATGTDAWAIQVARSGVPTALVSIPSRYMHSTIETVALADIERVGRLLAQLVAGLETDVVDALADQAGDWGPIDVAAGDVPAPTGA